MVKSTASSTTATDSLLSCLHMLCLLAWWETNWQHMVWQTYGMPFNQSGTTLCSHSLSKGWHAMQKQWHEVQPVQTIFFPSLTVAILFFAFYWKYSWLPWPWPWPWLGWPLSNWPLPVCLIIMWSQAVVCGIKISGGGMPGHLYDIFEWGVHQGWLI